VVKVGVLGGGEGLHVVGEQGLPDHAASSADLLCERASDPRAYNPGGNRGQAASEPGLTPSSVGEDNVDQRAGRSRVVLRCPPPHGRLPSP
jgi:hypothetical protein